MQPIRVTHFSDPGCPWAYSAAPALAALRWRYGDQLDWRLVLIGLTEDARQYEERGYTPGRSAAGMLMFRRRWGMPFAPVPRAGVAATSRACRAVVAARLQAPALGDAAFRALQFLQFATPQRLDDDAALAAALEAVVGLDAEAVVASIDDEAIRSAYEADRDAARSAEGGPTHWQGKAANSDGRWRYTAPSLIFEREGRLEAGGFQPLEAYDVVLANMPPLLDRRPAPDDVRDALAAEPLGLTTAEAAEILRPTGNDAPDREGTERELVLAAADGDAVRVGLGGDAIWFAPDYAEGAPASRLRASAIAALSGVAPSALARS